MPTQSQARQRSQSRCLRADRDRTRVPWCLLVLGGGVGRGGRACRDTPGDHRVALRHLQRNRGELHRVAREGEDAPEKGLPRLRALVAEVPEDVRDAVGLLHRDRLQRLLVVRLEGVDLVGGQSFVVALEVLPDLAGSYRSTPSGKRSDVQPAGARQIISPLVGGNRQLAGKRSVPESNPRSGVLEAVEGAIGRVDVGRIDLPHAADERSHHRQHCVPQIRERQPHPGQEPLRGAERVLADLGLGEAGAEGLVERGLLVDEALHTPVFDGVAEVA